jgi:hypothetical protein
LGGLANVSITGNENYGIYWMHNAFTNLLFNDQALTPGQEISVGGPDPTASPFTVKRIHLRNWGYNGTIVAGSGTPGAGHLPDECDGLCGAGYSPRRSPSIWARVATSATDSGNSRPDG